MASKSSKHTAKLRVEVEKDQLKHHYLVEAWLDLLTAASPQPDGTNPLADPESPGDFHEPAHAAPR